MTRVTRVADPMKPTSSSPTGERAPRPVASGDGLRIAAAFAGRLLIVGAAIAAALWVAARLSNVVIPLMIGVVVAALLVPFSNWLQHHRWPKWLAVIASLAAVLAGFAILVFLVLWRVQTSLPRLQNRAVAVIDQIQRLARHSTLQLPTLNVDTVGATVRSFIEDHAAQLQAGIAVAGSGLVDFGEGLFIVLFVTIFALTGGRHMWQWVITLFPKKAQTRLAVAGEAGWETLTHFIRIQIVIAATDAAGIGLGAFFLGLPLATPIGVIVFIGAFIPVVGAFAAGAVAVLIALLFKGWVAALIMLGVVILVQQLEGEVLHPFLTGSIVAIHPLGILLAVIAGTTLAGIPGGFFAVPLVSVANSMIRAARQGTPDVEEMLLLPAATGRK